MECCAADNIDTLGQELQQEPVWQGHSVVPMRQKITDMLIQPLRHDCENSEDKFPSDEIRNSKKHRKIEKFKSLRESHKLHPQVNKRAIYRMYRIPDGLNGYDEFKL